jgi:hypothetical protein
MAENRTAYYIASDVVTKKMFISDGFFVDWPIWYSGYARFDRPERWPVTWIKRVDRAFNVRS